VRSEVGADFLTILLGRTEVRLRMRRVISGLAGGGLLLGTVAETWRQILWFYREHYVWPMEKYGVLTPLRWQEIGFLAAFLVLALALVYAWYRLIKYATRTDRTAVVS
jgi:hypothetical protein